MPNGPYRRVRIEPRFGSPRLAGRSGAAGEWIDNGTTTITGTPGQLIFDLQPAALRFFTSTGPITGFPTGPLAPGDRVIAQDRVLEGGVLAGHDDEACTVGFARDVLCQDIAVLGGRGDVQASWSFRWPATGNRGPASFDGIIDGGTGAFRDARGDFHAQALPNGDLRITATIGSG